MIVVPKGVCKNILSGRREGSAVNIFVVLLGTAQLSFLMGTAACQGEKLPLPPRLLHRDTGSHLKVKETTTVTPVSGKSWADRASVLQRGSRCRCCPFLQATGIFPQATSLLYSQRQFRPRDEFRIGQLLIVAWICQQPQEQRACFSVRVCNVDRAFTPAGRPPVHAMHTWAGGDARGQTEGPCVAGRALQHPSHHLPAPFPTGGCTAVSVGLTQSD